MGIDVPDVFTSALSGTLPAMGRALLLGVQKVELIGGEGWLEHNSVAIAAIAAAAMAALVAILNRRAQLEHDREMRNRDHIRDAIDEAVVVANETRNVSDRFTIAVKAAERRRAGEKADLGEDVVSALVEEREEALAKLHAMRAARTRLEIRMEASDPVRTSYSRLVDAFVDLFRGAHKGIRENRAAEFREADDERERKLEGDFTSFQEACRDWFTDGPRKILGLSLRRRRLRS